MLICPKCGEEAPERARFCQSCGTSLVESQAASEERKVMTVLFCDLVGFTSSSEQADPEDVSVSLAEGGPGLGTMWGRELATRMFHDAGFTSVEERPAPTQDPINTIYLCKP